MIAGKEYNGLLADIWSSGVTLYAMLCGYLPFEDPDTTELYKKILKGEYEEPEFLSENAKDILKKVMNTNPETRYKINDIRKHPWYSLVKPEENNEGILVGYKQIPINTSIISELANYNIDPVYAQQCLEANRHNEVTTTYYLLSKKYLREGKPSQNTKVPIMTNNNSKELIVKEDSDYVNQEVPTYDNRGRSWITSYEHSSNSMRRKTCFGNKANFSNNNSNPLSNRLDSTLMNAKIPKNNSKKIKTTDGSNYDTKFYSPYHDDKSLSICNNMSFKILAENNESKDRLNMICEMYKNVITQTNPNHKKIQPATNLFLQKTTIKIPQSINNFRSISKEFSNRRKNKIENRNLSSYATKLNTTVRSVTKLQLQKNKKYTIPNQLENQFRTNNIFQLNIMPTNSKISYGNFNIKNISIGKIKKSKETERPKLPNFMYRKYNPKIFSKEGKNNLSIS